MSAVSFFIANAAGDGRRNAAKQPARARVQKKKNAESPPSSLDPFIVVVVVSAVVAVVAVAAAAVGKRSQLACRLFARAHALASSQLFARRSRSSPFLDKFLPPQNSSRAATMAVAADVRKQAKSVGSTVFRIAHLLAAKSGGDGARALRNDARVLQRAPLASVGYQSAHTRAAPLLDCTCAYSSSSSSSMSTSVG